MKTLKKVQVPHWKTHVSTTEIYIILHRYILYYSIPLDYCYRHDVGEDEESGNQLCIGNLQDVYSLLIPAAKDWFDLGLALKIKVDTLEGIESNKDTDKARLRGMLTHWLRSSPSRTWSDICNGLRSDTVQQTNLADTIEEKYRGSVSISGHCSDHKHAN